MYLVWPNVKIRIVNLFYNKDLIILCLFSVSLNIYDQCKNSCNFINDSIHCLYFISFSKELNHFIRHHNNTKTAVGRIVISEKIKWLSTTYYTKSAISGSIRKEFTSSCVYPRYRVLCISWPGSLSWPKLITGEYSSKDV